MPIRNAVKLDLCELGSRKPPFHFYYFHGTVAFDGSVYRTKVGDLASNNPLVCTLCFNPQTIMFEISLSACRVNGRQYEAQKVMFSRVKSSSSSIEEGLI